MPITIIVPSAAGSGTYQNSRAMAQSMAEGFGTTVEKLAKLVSGAAMSKRFADLGAEVIKLERVEGGDDARNMGAAFRYGDALNFHVFNRGKKSVAIDLKQAEGMAAFERLAATADIFIHNMRPGVTKALGIDGEALCALHPQLIYCEISAFGHTGPMHMQPGYEPLIQAFSGLSSINGGPDDPPMRSGASVCDQGTGMWAVIGALAMLQRRGHSGRGGVVSTSLLETALGWVGQKADAYVNLGRLPERHRSGHPGFVPYESFETKDAPILICCGNDRLFAKFALELGHAEWLSDERFSSNRNRLANKIALLERLIPVLSAHTRAEWVARFNAAGVPCAPVNTVPEALEDAQVQALQMQSLVPGEDFVLTALPISFDGQRPEHRSVAPRLGQHNQEFNVPEKNK